MTRAQTRFAYKLKKYILAEPKQVHMSYFYLNVENFREAGADLTLNVGETCGTVGCIGGTACFLKIGKDWTKTGEMEYTARGVLGLTESQANALFYFPFGRPSETAREDWALYATERRQLKRLVPGTQKYANVVASAVQKTIDAYGFKGRL